MSVVTPYDVWPDTEIVVIQWLLDQLPDDVEVRPESDDELTTPYVLVQRVPGGTSDDVNDRVTLDVDVFGADRAAMWRLAERVHAAMLNLTAHAAWGCFVDEVHTDMNFGYVGYRNPTLRRATATYRITTRPQASVPRP